LSGSYLTSLVANPPLQSSGSGSLTVSLAKANGSTDGYLSGADWTTFNGKQSALGFVPLNSAGGALSGDFVACHA